MGMDQTYPWVRHAPNTLQVCGFAMWRDASWGGPNASVDYLMFALVAQSMRDVSKVHSNELTTALVMCARRS
jgi:hypothetical protein